MKKLLLFAVALFGTFAFTQCANNTKNSGAIDTTEVMEQITLGTRWNLILITIDSTEVPAPEAEQNGEPVFITFADSTQFNGFAGCNYYFGVYNMNDDCTLELIPQGSTRMSGKNLHIENAFLPSLEKVKSYTLKDSVLTFKDSNGNNLMVFGQK